MTATATSKRQDMAPAITPIVRTVQVKAPPPRAFDLFTRQMGKWWGKGIGKNPHVDVIVEPRVGGRWFERDAQGNETQWGKVLAWQPPGRLLLAWQITCDWRYDPKLLTEVELTFSPMAEGGTLVTLEHRNLERFGTDAALHAGRLNGGWPTKLSTFTAYVDTGVLTASDASCPTSAA